MRQPKTRKPRSLKRIIADFYWRLIGKKYWCCNYWKTTGHHHNCKTVKHRTKKIVNQGEIHIVDYAERCICNDCSDMDKFLIKQCTPTPYNTCKEFKQL